MLMDAEHLQRLVRDGESDVALRPYLGEIARAAQQPVGDTRRAAAASRNLKGAIVVHGDPQDRCGTAHDNDEFFRRVKLQPMNDAEARTQRRSHQSRAGRGPDQREAVQDEWMNPRPRALSDHQINPVILHRRVQNFLDRGNQAVNFIEEENFTLLERSEDRGQVALAFQQRAGTRLDHDAQLAGDDLRERRAGHDAWQTFLHPRLASRTRTHLVTSPAPAAVATIAPATIIVRRARPSAPARSTAATWRAAMPQTIPARHSRRRVRQPAPRRVAHSRD